MRPMEAGLGEVAGLGHQGPLCQARCKEQVAPTSLHRCHGYHPGTGPQEVPPSSPLPA